MPVQKFRTFEAAEYAMVSRRSAGSDDGATLPARIAALWAMSSALTTPIVRRGVRKFRTTEEADADRDRMTIER